MYYDVKDIDLTEKEIQFLKDVSKGYSPNEGQFVLPLMGHDLIRFDKDNSVQITSKGTRFLEILKKRSKERLIWSVVVPILVAVLTAYITTKLSLL